MGDHGVDVDFGRSGRHRAESRDELRAQAVELPELLELLELLVALRSGLGIDQRGIDQRGIDQRGDGARSGDRPGGEREGRHSAARSSVGSRPWTVSTGRHAAERQALRQPVARSGRHRAPGAEPDPVTAGGVTRGGLTSGGLTSGGLMNRWSTVAAIVERAMRHETPVSALVRETSVSPLGPSPVRAVREAPAARPIDDEVAERWTAEHWMPTQRRSEPGDAVARPAVRPVGWHPVPRPRHSADGGSANLSVSGVAERLAG